MTRVVSLAVGRGRFRAYSAGSMPSGSFANPAVTVARSASDTFAGIRPDDVIGFIVSQLAGALAATLTVRRLGGDKSRRSW